MSMQLPPTGPPPQPRPGMPPQPYNPGQPMQQAPGQPPAAWGAPPQAPPQNGPPQAWGNPGSYTPAVNAPQAQYPPTGFPAAQPGTPPLQPLLPTQAAPPAAVPQQPAQQPMMNRQTAMQQPLQTPPATAAAVAGYQVAQQTPPPATPPQAPPPPQQQGPPGAGVVAKSIPQLLKEFGRKPGCERYAADGERIKLMTDYLWLRQLTPSLPFETFLELYQPLADFDELNNKHPEDAIKSFLPRTKKAADEKSLHHWSAKEVVEFVSLYIDMIRAAESTQQPVPMDLNTFLQNLQTPFLAGAFKEPEPPKALPGQQSLPFTDESGAVIGTQVGTRKPRAAKAKPETVITRPSGNGQRVCYTWPTGRQIRGVTTNMVVNDGGTFFDVQSDEGEMFQAMEQSGLEIITDPLPPTPDTSPEAAGVLARQTLFIPKAAYPSVRNALTLTTPMGNVALGDAIYPYAVGFPNGLEASIEVINGETGPYVDARLVNPQGDIVLFECPPRNNIEGIYQFQTPEGVYEVEVKGRE